MEREQLLHRAEAPTLVCHSAVATGPSSSVRTELEVEVTSYFTGESGTERGRWFELQRRSVVQLTLQLLPPNPNSKEKPMRTTGAASAPLAWETGRLRALSSRPSD